METENLQNLKLAPLGSVAHALVEAFNRLNTAYRTIPPGGDEKIAEWSIEQVQVLEGRIGQLKRYVEQLEKELRILRDPDPEPEPPPIVADLTPSEMKWWRKKLDDALDRETMLVSVLTSLRVENRELTGAIKPEG